MGREARRAQARQERRQRQQKMQTRARPPALTASAAEQTRGGSLLKPRWATDIISELRKVTWPSRQEVFHLTLVVVVVSLAIGLLLGAADLAFGWFIEHVVLPQR